MSKTPRTRAQRPAPAPPSAPAPPEPQKPPGAEVTHDASPAPQGRRRAKKATEALSALVSGLRPAPTPAQPAHPSQPSQPSQPTQPAPRRAERCAALIERLCAGLVEREEPVTLALLATLAGESVFLLGPPGTAKSLISRRLACALKRDEGGPTQEFHYLMGRFSTPEELFGPISVRGLKDDRYERKVEGYLPSAHVAFLDELWKASPSIQNALLTAVNERVFRNGAQELKMPLRALVAASNELPAPGKGLEALWDRFLVRAWVGGVRGAAGWLEVLCAQDDPYEDPLAARPELKVTLSELDEWRREARAVEVPDGVRALLVSLRVGVDELARREREQGRALYVSDRRWRKLVGLLKSSAYLSDRRALSAVDVALAPWCLWEHPEQLAPLQELTRKMLGDAAFGVDLMWQGLFERAERLYELVRDSRERKRAAENERPWSPHYGQDFYTELERLKERASARLALLKRRAESLAAGSVFLPPSAREPLVWGARVAAGALCYLIEELDLLAQRARAPRAWLPPESPFTPPRQPSREVHTEPARYWRGTLLNEPLARGEHLATLELCYCPPGEGVMGTNTRDPESHYFEGPRHTVRVTRGLWVGVTPVTHAQYLAVMGYTTANLKRLNTPVTRVSWFDAVRFCNELSEQRGLTPVYALSVSGYDWSRPTVAINTDADGYRLLTEAEWERCARAEGEGELELAGGEPAGGTLGPRVVKQGRPNRWGLYDMSGNVGEWCNDVCDIEEDAYAPQGGLRVDPLAHLEQPSTRVVRGGRSGGDSNTGAVWARDFHEPNESLRFIGLRVARLAR